MKEFLAILLCLLVSTSAFSQTQPDSATLKIQDATVIPKKPHVVDAEKEKAKVFFDSLSTILDIAQREKVIDKLSDDADRSFGNSVVGLTAFFFTVGIWLGLLYAFEYIFKELEIPDGSFKTIAGLIVFAVVTGLVVNYNTYITMSYKYLLFRNPDPTEEQMKFTALYSNITHFYSRVSEVPLVSKLIATIGAILALLAFIKTAYELYHFFNQKKVVP